MSRMYVVLVMLAMMIFPGLPYPPQSAAAQSKAIDLIVVVDGSGSISPPDFELERLYAGSLLNSCLLGADAQVGLVQFSSAVITESALTNNLDLVKSKVFGMRQLTGSTDTAAGLSRADSLLQASSRKATQVVVLITDGVPNDQAAAEQAGKALRDRGVLGYGVGVGNLDQNALQNVVGPNPIFTAANFGDLNSTLAALVNAVCQAPVVLITPSKQSQKTALITVVQRPNPNTGASAGTTISYTVVITNRGKGGADNVALTMPFDPAEVKLLDAKFTRDTAWVSKITANSVQFETGALGKNGDVITGTIRFTVNANTAAGTSLAERISYTWINDSRSGSQGMSNETMVAVAAANDHRPTYTMKASPEKGPVGSTHTFSSGIFVPNEPVTLWYNTPDGKVVAVDTVAADDKGMLSEPFKTSSLAKGSYSMVAHGNWSKFIATATFVVE